VPAGRVGRLILVKITVASALTSGVWWCMRGCARLISAGIWTASWPGDRVGEHPGSGGGAGGVRGRGRAHR
jgi:hypothetical protein